MVPRRAATLLAVLALLLQLGAPVLNDPAGPSAAAPWLGAPLCHAARSAGRGPASSVPSGPAQACQCPLCFLLQAGGVFLAPPDPADFVPVAVTLPPLPQPAALRPIEAASIAARPRAPPAPVAERVFAA